MSFYTSDGIFVDDSKNEQVIIYRPLGRFMTLEHSKLVDNKQLPKLKTDNIILKKDEYCCFIGDAKTYKSKTITTGYVSKRQGGSLRITRGLSYHSGTGQSQAIRETQTTMFNGIIYITNKRVIYVSQGGDSFDKPIEKLTCVDELKDGIVIQIGSKSYTIELETHILFMQVLNLVKNKEFGIELPEIMSNPNVLYTIDSKVLKNQKKPLSYYTDIIMKPIRAYSNLPEKTKWYIFIFIAIALIIILSSRLNNSPAMKERENQRKQDIIEKFINVGFSEEEAIEAMNILMKAQVTSISNLIEQDKNTDNTSEIKKDNYDKLFICNRI